MTDIEKFKKIIDENNKILFFTGAGVSTLSGIPDFRSANGLYNNHKYKKSPEEMLSKTFFFSHTKEFYDFYKETFDCRKYQSNIVHEKMAILEKTGKSIGIITQNVDGLHTKAGSENVIEYHGSIYRNSCRNKCNGFAGTVSANYVFDSEGIPRCPKCNAVIKPDVTFYEETPYDHYKALQMITECDVFVVCGSSLNVYPAAGFVNHLNPDTQKLVIINKEPTHYDYMADLCIHDDLGKVFAEI